MGFAQDAVMMHDDSRLVQMDRMKFVKTLEHQDVIVDSERQEHLDCGRLDLIVTYRDIRVDDVINVSGHRIGTAEVESALVSHPQCAEAAGLELSMRSKGREYMHLSHWWKVFLTVKNSRNLILTVRNQIGAFAAPDKIHWAPGLPKTRSGKIMRRILRKIASRQLDELGDTSTLADPSVVDQLISLSDC
ncbi:acetyl-coenzyme A synthetase, chloroplastic/glyoxysomal-like [Elaeis guineensis]|uniref:acetyl-coenzyme A synthetase, chloroplastic/glyoxysomal-like n=1 Tax=Elaeis guineensis var. tenera TaxID=51953 RepID=UPI003C6CE9BD